jgi:hypothetical protein
MGPTDSERELPIDVTEDNWPELKSQGYLWMTNIDRQPGIEENKYLDMMRKKYGKALLTGYAMDIYSSPNRPAVYKHNLAGVYVDTSAIFKQSKRLEEAA